MAAANRYTRLTPSQYNPMSLQELMMVPAMKRQQHDAAVAQATQLGLFDIVGVDKDKEKLRDVVGQYEGVTNEFIDQISKEGIKQNDTRKLIELYNKKKDLNEKYFNPAKANAEAISKYANDMKDPDIIGEWDPQLAQRYASQQVGRFQGTFNPDGSTNKFSGNYMPKYVDANKMMDEAIGNVESDQMQTLMKKYNIQNADSFRDFLSSDKVDHLDKSKIIQAVQTQMKGNLAFQKSYMTEYGLSGGTENPFEFGKFEKNDDGEYEYKVNTKSPLDLMLYGKALGKAFKKESKSFSSNQRALDLYKAKQSLEEAEVDPRVPYNRSVYEHKEIFNKSFISKLSEVGEQVYDKASGTLPAPGNVVGSNAKNQTIQDVLDQDELARYEVLVSKLRETSFDNKFLITEDMGTYDSSTVRAVQDYMSRYQNVKVSNTTFKPMEVENTYMAEGVPFNSKDSSKADKGIIEDVIAGQRILYDANGNQLEVEDGEVITDYGDGIGDFNLSEADAFYTGFLGPENSVKLGNQNTDGVMPHQVNINGKNYFVSRISSERETPLYRASSRIKETVDAGLEYPGLAHKMDVQDPELQEKGITDLITTFDPATQKYKLTVKRGNNVSNYDNLDYNSFYRGMYNLYSQNKAQ